MPVLWHQSGVNRKGEPFVQLLRDDQVVCQLSPEEARDHARNVLEATEAAEQDAFMLSWAMEKTGVTQGQAMGLVIEFRKWREARGKKGPVSDASEFVITDKHEKPPQGESL